MPDPPDFRRDPNTRLGGTSIHGPSRTLVLLVWALLALIWGSTWSVVKVGLGDLPPFALLAMRMAFGTATCVAWALARGGLRLPLRQEWPWVGVSLLGQFLVPLPLLFWGGNRLGSAVTALVFATTPLWTALTSAALGWERVVARSYLGLALGLGGLAAILVPGFHGLLSLPGLLAILGGALSIGASATVVKRHCGSWDIPTVMAFQFAMTGLWCLLLRSLAGESAPRWGAHGLASALYLGVVATVGTNVGMVWLFRHMSAVSTTMLVLADALVAMALGALWLKEPMGLRIFLAAAGVFGGFLLTLDRRPDRRGPRAPGSDQERHTLR